MKILLSTMPRPVPLLMDTFLSLDDSSYRFVVDQGVFSVRSDNHVYSLHFLAQNIAMPSTVLEWPSWEELEAELKREAYDFFGLHCKVIDLDRIGQVIDFVHSVSPGTKVIIGGFGTLGLEELREEGIDAADKADYVCRGEGVDFLNALAGVNHRLPRICRMPLERMWLPWLPGSETKIGYMLSALGCPIRCEFCATTAFVPGGRVHEVMTARELYEAGRWYFDTHRDFHQVYLMDENFLAYKKKVNELGEYIRNDDAYGLERMNYQVFGTIRAVSMWDPEELLLNGISGVWSGIESFFSYDRKKRGNVQELVDGLHNNGITTILSWILGDDVQTKENIEQDVDMFLALRPPAAQLSVLIAMPGTPLRQRVKESGRLLPFRAGEMHLLGNSMRSLHFTHEERVRIVMDTYRKAYHRNGPTVMRSFDIELNGYNVCRKSNNPQLNTRKLKYYKTRVLNGASMLKTAKAFAPNDHVRHMMEELERKYVESVGPLTKSQQIVADKYLKLAEEYVGSLKTQPWPPPVTQPGLSRSEYPGVDPGIVKAAQMVPLSVGTP